MEAWHSIGGGTSLVEEFQQVVASPCSDRTSKALEYGSCLCPGASK